MSFCSVDRSGLLSTSSIRSNTPERHHNSCLPVSETLDSPDHTSQSELHGTYELPRMQSRGFRQSSGMSRVWGAAHGCPASALKRGGPPAAVRLGYLQPVRALGPNRISWFGLAARAGVYRKRRNNRSRRNDEDRQPRSISKGLRLVVDLKNFLGAHRVRIRHRTCGHNLLFGQ